MKKPKCTLEVNEIRMDKEYNQNHNNMFLSILQERKNFVMSSNAENNVMIGKRYSLRSSSGINVFSFGTGTVYSTVTVDEEKMSIEMIPKKMNKIPVVYFEDITKVMVNRKLSLYYVMLILLSVILGIANPVGFVLAAGFLWLGINRKIIIFLRNGNQAVLYCRKKKVCEEFVQDLENTAGINKKSIM